MNFKSIKLKDSNYPPLLREINDPPKMIYLRGLLPPFETPAIAIVGTRKATASGIKIAEEMAAELAQAGITIISGLAMGIDSAAHRGALEANGRTIAVLAGGIDKIYPAQNERLAETILTGGGGIISESGPGEPSFKGNFIRRNRIISGLSIGVLIIEAPTRSGAIATAGFAAEQGRNVFVVPGSISHSNYVGSHALIRDGATLITKAAEILEELEIVSPNVASLNRLFNLDETAIIEVIRAAGEPLGVDRIAEFAKLPPQKVNQILTPLILQGVIQEISGKYTFR